MVSSDSAGPGRAGPGTLGPGFPADDAGDGDVDVLCLAGRRPPDEGAWLWATVVDGRPGGDFSALVLPRNRPCASGGDVVLHLAPAASWEEEQQAGPAAQVRVWAVVAGSLVPVAAWGRLGLDGWPETVRVPVAFAMEVLNELQEHGADVGARQQVDLETAAGLSPAGFPGLPVSVRAAADG